MNDDDDRVAYVAGEDGIELDDATRADLDELRALLADETVWAMPPAGLEDSIVAAIAAETTDRADPATTAVAAPAAVSGPPPPATVSSLAERRARRIRRVL